MDFSHNDLTVAAGTTVGWTNAGAVIHTTTSDDGLWDSGVLDSSQSFDFTFDQAGTFTYFCAIHPSMTGTITVTGTQGAQQDPATVAAPTTPPTGQPAPTATTALAPTSMPQPTVTPAPAPEGTPPVTVALDMKNFQHPDANVQAGATVIWTNADSVQHTVTSGSPTDPEPGSLFDSGSDRADWVAGGATHTLTFDEAGVFPYYCRIHGASMSETITVVLAEPAAVAPSPTTATATPEPAAVSGDLTANADIQDFRHQDLTVQAGTAVVWTNLEGVSHTITARQGQWDSGRFREGESFTFTFAEAGVFSYFCSIHPSMTAEVTVND